MKYLLFSVLLSFLFSVAGFSQVAEKAEDISPLLIGEKIPDVSVVSTEGIEGQIFSFLNGQKTVLLFYRGGWCAYCNAHLSEVGLAESEIMELGYNVVAISPDSPEKLKMTIEQGNFKYSVYSDATGSLIKSMGLAFKAPDRYSDMLAKFSDDINPGLLPVPSLFVVDPEGTILFEYISPDYKQRIGADFLVEVLKQINKEQEQG